MPVRQFLTYVAHVVQRDPDVFLQAVKATCIMEEHPGRVPVLSARKKVCLRFDLAELCACRWSASATALDLFICSYCSMLLRHTTCLLPNNANIGVSDESTCSCSEDVAVNAVCCMGCIYL